MADWDESPSTGWKTGANKDYWKGSTKPLEATDDVNFNKSKKANGKSNDHNAANHFAPGSGINVLGFTANGNKFGGDFGGGSGDECRNCGQEGHFARECSEPKKSGGECYNCGEIGHNKADCTNPRIARLFTGICRICNQEGHPAAECPDKSPEVCKNCQQQGHKISECHAARALDYTGVPDMDPNEAWKLLQKASSGRDIDEFKEALRILTKADRTQTYESLERKFRAAGFSIYLIALERELATAMASVNLQGKSDCKYVVGFYYSARPKRAKFADGWPSSPDENLEHVQDAGIVMEQVQPVCRNCDREFLPCSKQSIGVGGMELGHISKNCTEERLENAKEEITCNNCNATGHRQRDCPQTRQIRGACKNCGQAGHKDADCTEPRSAEGIKCRKCNETGHFSKDCPTGQGSGGSGCRNCGEEGHMAKECEKPRNPDTVTCRNCDKMGHFSRDCAEPRDWSRVKCSNCGEMGHTINRCKQPVAQGENGNGGFDDAGTGGFENFGSAGAETGEFDQAPAATAITGAWNSRVDTSGGW